MKYLIDRSKSQIFCEDNDIWKIVINSLAQLSIGWAYLCQFTWKIPIQQESQRCGLRQK